MSSSHVLYKTKLQHMSIPYMSFDFYGFKDLEYTIMPINSSDMKESGVKERNMVSLLQYFYWNKQLNLIMINSNNNNNNNNNTNNNNNKLYYRVKTF